MSDIQTGNENADSVLDIVEQREQELRPDDPAVAPEASSAAVPAPTPTPTTDPLVSGSAVTSGVPSVVSEVQDELGTASGAAMFGGPADASLLGSYAFVLAGYHQTAPGQKPMPNIRRVQELANEVFEMPAPALRQLQLKLWLGGFYGETSLDEMRFGAADPDTYQAALKFYEYAAQVNTTREITAPDLLDLLAENGIESGALDEETTPITLSDPAALGGVLTNVYSQFVGRNPTSREQRAFVALVHNMQSRNRAAALNRRYRGVLTHTPGQAQGQVAVDPTSQAIEFAQDTAPQEIAGQSALSAYDTITDFIRERS